jgi:hypothetical protein
MFRSCYCFDRTQMMRKFFEEKLADLLTALTEKEIERDQLKHELDLSEKRSGASQELMNLLEKKQEQIDSLKKMQANYKRQTMDSSQRSEGIDRLAQLQNDVKFMKKRKADMQKELALEKKHHMLELGKLNKMVSQRDREISKIQKISNQQSVDMEKAKAVSKNRFEELSQLKKALRLYKRGVGLDPVLVGRRQARSKSGRENERKFDSEEGHLPVFVADSIRDYFDSKVAVVVRKEALVDRLALEYFDLITRRHDDTISSDTREALEIQIQFKNDKIRKIARRLHRQEISSGVADEELQKTGDCFIFDEQFSKLVLGK